MKNPASSTFVLLFIYGILSIQLKRSSALSLSQQGTVVNTSTRRKVLGSLMGTMPVFALADGAQAANKQSIASRLDEDMLTMPPASRASELNGVGE